MPSSTRSTRAASPTPTGTGCSSDLNALNSPFSQAMLGVIMTDDIEGLIKMVYDGGDQILAELYPRPDAGHESIDDGL